MVGAEETGSETAMQGVLQVNHDERDNEYICTYERCKSKADNKNTKHTSRVNEKKACQNHSKLFEMSVDVLICDQV